MTDLNHVVLIGRLTHDAEVKYLPNGSPVANLSIAVNQEFPFSESSNSAIISSV